MQATSLCSRYALSTRFQPAEWLNLAKELGLSDAQKREAISSLGALGYIQFKPQSTEILALTQEGVTVADALMRHGQSRQVNEPMPDTLEAIRADLDYWEVRLYDGDVGSPWWEQVQARIDGLRHRENRLMLIQAPVTITNNAFGPNSRFNQNSIDQSTNQVTETIRNSDWERLAEQISTSCRFLRADSQWTSSTQVEAWRLAGGESKICEAFLQKAGAMLLKSAQVRAQLLKVVVSEADNMSRWLLYLKEKGCHEVRFIANEDLENGTKITHLVGGIRDLIRDSVRVCIECAALET